MMVLKLTTLQLLLISIFEFGFIDTFPAGYVYISSPRRAYYKFYKERATWSDAVSTCRSEGARLFHPDSADELEPVWRKLEVGDIYWIHSGFSDLKKLNEYVTVDGRPLSQVYHKWDLGEPITGGDFRCGAIDVDSHRLYIYHCSMTLRFICKHEEEVTATDVETVTAANSSYVAALELRLANQTAAVEVLKQEAATLKLQAANQSAVIDVMQREIEAMKKGYSENQT